MAIIRRGGAAYVSVSDLAERLGVHRNTVINWIRFGFIEAERMGPAPKSPYIIPVGEVQRLLEEIKGGPANGSSQ
jgi:excisionase family DNA binding protein